MLVGGLQKHSLIDFPGRPATVLFTQGCGWRCPYCHNGRLMPAQAPEPISPQSIFEHMETRPPEARNLVISGGEPTLQRDLIGFLREARKRGITCKLDTNGSRPQVLKEVLDLGLVEYVAMDVKGPLDRYGEFCGVDIYPDRVAESIALLKRGNVDYEFRCTVVPSLHSPEDFTYMGQSLNGGRVLYLQPFQAPNALDDDIRNSEEPSNAFMQACAERAAMWLRTLIRD